MEGDGKERKAKVGRMISSRVLRPRGRVGRIISSKVRREKGS